MPPGYTDFCCPCLPKPPYSWGCGTAGPNAGFQPSSKDQGKAGHSWERAA